MSLFELAAQVSSNDAKVFRPDDRKFRSRDASHPTQDQRRHCEAARHWHLIARRPDSRCRRPPKLMPEGRDKETQRNQWLPPPATYACLRSYRIPDSPRQPDHRRTSRWAKSLRTMHQKFGASSPAWPVAVLSGRAHNPLHAEAGEGQWRSDGDGPVWRKSGGRYGRPGQNFRLKSATLI